MNCINVFPKDFRMKTSTRLALALFSFLLITSFTPEAHAEGEYTLTIKNHVFTPDTLEVPADQKIKLIVVNEDPTPEEFESDELNREKVVNGNSKITLMIGPLKAGTYPFIGEFNEKTAKGQIIVK